MRNRTGCIVCRQRRVQCDEARPRCHNCIVKRRQCQYRAPPIPLAERRQPAYRPGELQVWPAVISSKSSSLLETSDHNKSKSVLTRFPASLPLRSEPRPLFGTSHLFPAALPKQTVELLHYFFHAVEAKNPLDRNLLITCIGQALKNSEELHPLLIIAATHHRMNLCGIKTFTPILLLHMNLCIRSVNTWISTRRGSALICAKRILTLCINECCKGDITRAETHLCGVVAILEPIWSLNLQKSDIVYDQYPKDQTESVVRYFMLALACVGCLRGRQFVSATGNSPAIVTSTKSIALHHWNSLDTVQNLHASADKVALEPETPYTLTWLRLFPIFYSQISSCTSNNLARNFDAWPLVHAVKSMTIMMDNAATLASTSSSRRTAYEEIWSKGASAKCFGACMRAHLETLEVCEQTEAQTNNALISSWTGFMAALILYNIFVLGMHDIGHQPLDGRIHRFLLTAIISDLQHHKPREIHIYGSSNLFSNSLYLWKAMVGITSVNQRRARGGYALQSHTSGPSPVRSDIRELSKWMEDEVTSWTPRVVPPGILIEDMLGYIAWPARH